MTNPDRPVTAEENAAAVRQLPSTAGVEPPPARAVALTAVRELPSGALRQYTATTFPADPWQGCEHAIRRAAKVGLLKPCQEHPKVYAVLDVLDDDGNILVSYDIPTAHAFRYWKRTMHWAVDEGSR